METTLHYFFSALFQGFAAIIALGSMFYLYFLQNVKKRKDEIISDLLRQYNQQRDVLNAIYMKGVIEYCREEVNKRNDDHVNLRLNTIRELLNEYDVLLSSYDGVKILLPKVLNTSIIILIASIICLFLVGYGNKLNSILLAIGIILICVSIYNLLLIKKVIIKILRQD